MSNKTVLLKLPIRKAQIYYMTDSAGVWYFDFSNVWPGIDSEVAETWPLESPRVEDISSVSYEGNDLTQIKSYTNTIDGRAAALSSEASFIYDGVNNILYFRLNNYDNPHTFDIWVGVAVHLSDQTYDDEANELIYRSDLIGVPGLTESKDSFFFQAMDFDNFAQEIDNSDRRYDGLINNRVLGQRAKYYLGNIEDDFSSFVQIKEGKVENITFNGDRIIVDIVDSRTKLSAELPPNVLSAEDYTDLDEDYIGAPKPLVYGYVRESPCMPLDDGTTQTNYTFMIADTEFHDIYNGVAGTDFFIYSDGVDVSAQVLNFSNSSGTFQIPAAYYTPGKDVTYTGYGYIDSLSAVIDNALDIVLDLLENYGNTTFISANFNLTEWSAETLLAKDIGGISIIKNSILFDVIGDIAGKTGGAFLLERDGRFTWRTYQEDREPVLTIYEYNWKTEPVISSSYKEIFSSVKIKYNQAINSGKWSVYFDDTNKGRYFSQYGIYNPQTFESLFTNEDDAKNYAESLISRSEGELTIISGVIDDKYIDYETAKPGLIAQVEINRQAGPYEFNPWIEKIKCEIIEVTPRTEARECEIVLRKIESIDEFNLLTGVIRVTSDGSFRITSSGAYRTVNI